MGKDDPTFLREKNLVSEEGTNHCKVDVAIKTKLTVMKEIVKDYVMEERINLSKAAKDDNKRNNDERKQRLDELESDFYFFEYVCIIGIIFNYNFMNQKERLNKMNFEEKKKTMEFCLNYFVEWDESVRAMKCKREEQLKCFLAWVTYRNLRLMIAGFFEYSRIVLYDPESPVKYVLFLHSNQSTIELTFSVIRAKGFDNVRDFGTGICNQELIKNLKLSKALENNPMCVGTMEESEEELHSKTLHDRIFGSKIDERSSKYEEIKNNSWLVQHRNVVQIDIMMQLNYRNSRSEKVQSISETNNEVIKEMLIKKIECHYATLLLNHEKIQRLFEESCQALMGTDKEAWVRSFFSMSCEEINYFDEFCQMCMRLIVKGFLKAINTKGAQKAEISCNYNYMVSLNTAEFSTQICGRLPKGMQDYHEVNTWIFQLLSRIFNYWIADMVQNKAEEMVYRNDEIMDVAQNDNTQEKTLLNKEQCAMEVQRFFGIGIKRAIDNQKLKGNKFRRGENLSGYEKHLNEMKVVKMMRILHEDVVSEKDPDMEEYRNKYYPTFLKLWNHGGYCLVAPMFMSFGLKVMNEIRMHVHENSFCEKGGDALSSAMNRIMSHTELKLMFYKAMIQSQVQLRKNGEWVLSGKTSSEETSDSWFKDIDGEIENIQQEDDVDRLIEKYDLFTKVFCDGVMKIVIRSTFNARSKAFMNFFKQKHLSRYSSSKDTGHRDGFKVALKQKCERIGEEVRKKLKKGETSPGDDGTSTESANDTTIADDNDNRKSRNTGRKRMLQDDDMNDNSSSTTRSTANKKTKR